MSVRLKQRDFAAISVIESYAELREPLYDLLEWPALTLEQRGLFVLIWTLCHRNGSDLPYVSDVGTALGLDPEGVRSLLKGRDMPFMVSKDDRVCPTEALAYGRQS